MKSKEEKIMTIAFTCQVLLNQIHDSKADGVFAQKLKLMAKNFFEQLVKVEKVHFDDWLNSDAESQAENVYTIYENFIKRMAKVPINYMPAMEKTADCWEINPKSMNTSVTRILKSHESKKED